MKRFKEIMAARKDKARLAEETNIKAEFRVVERGGDLWLTHDGVAFCAIPSDATSGQITEMLERARLTAVKYNAL